MEFQNRAHNELKAELAGVETVAIYRKHKDFENERRVLEHSIRFVTELRESQKKYVLWLASEYNSCDKALEYINRGQKIHYYGGAFVHYDPVKVLGKWEVNGLKLLGN